jgi:signal transduction protein with GAF and PtsI domain
VDAVLTSLSNEENEKAILDGEFTFVFCNPESIIRNAKWREMVSFEIYIQDKFACFCINIQSSRRPKEVCLINLNTNFFECILQD